MSDSGGHRGLAPSGDWLDDPRQEMVERSGAGFPFLLAATALAALVRLYGLMSQSLWVDELLTWNAVRPGVGLHFLEQIADTIQGPLYMAIIWPLVRLQDPALMMRLPSVVAGIAAVPLFGILVGSWWGRRAARLAVLLFALNPFLVWYSQEGRGYSLLVFFLIAQALVFSAMARRGPDLRHAVLFALCTAGAVGSNLSGLFLWAAMGLSVILFFRPRTPQAWLGWTVAFGLGLGLVAPWLLKASGIWAIDRIVPGAGIGPDLRGETTFTWMALPYSLFSFFFGTCLGPSLRELHQPDRLAVVKSSLPLLAAAAVPVGLGLLAGVWRLPRRHWFLLLWILVPVAILVLLAIRNVKPWNPRYVMVVLPWVLAVAALGLARLPGRWGLVLGILLTGLTLWSLGNYYWNGRYAKADVRGAEALIAAQNPLDLPILVPSVTGVYKFYHQGPAEILGVFEWPPLANAAAADEFCTARLESIDECWLVLARDWDFDPRGLLRPALSRIGRLVLVETLPGTRVYRWSRTAPGK